MKKINYSKQNAELFKQKILEHIKDPNTIAIAGKYHAEDVIHFYNFKTQLNVIKTKSGEFLSGWKLSKDQLDHLRKHGKLGGN